jgi:metal-responsive CopG/Arc/MetJ family transcriptional regulator
MRTTQAISVTIPKELAEKMDKLQKTKLKNYSTIVTEALRGYLVREEYENQIKKMSESAKKAGVVSEEDIYRIVQEVRSGKKSK